MAILENLSKPLPSLLANRCANYLLARTQGLGVCGFFVEDGSPLFLEDALDERGAIFQAVLIHAQTMAALNFSEPAFPLTWVDDTFAELSTEDGQSNISPAQMLFYLDASIEHLVLSAIHSLGITSEEFLTMPPEDRFLSAEFIFDEIKNNPIVSQGLSQLTIPQALAAWPILEVSTSYDSAITEKPASKKDFFDGLRSN